MLKNAQKCHFMNVLKWRAARAHWKISETDFWDKIDAFWFLYHWKNYKTDECEYY